MGEMAAAGSSRLVLVVQASGTEEAGETSALHHPAVPTPALHHLILSPLFWQPWPSPADLTPQIWMELCLFYCWVFFS